jgi:hypothetical protein
MIPGYTYEHEEITTPFGDTVGNTIAHIGATLPFTTIGRLKPTHPVTWALHGIVLTVTTMVWILLAGGWLVLLGLVLIIFENSWRSMRER